jgi:hypothetical protein
MQLQFTTGGVWYTASYSTSYQLRRRLRHVVKQSKRTLQQQPNTRTSSTISVGVK